MSKKGNMLIAQSGGPTAAINASLAGAVEQAVKSREIGKIYGARHGVEGILRGDLADLRALLPTDEDLQRLRRTPAMALGSCRKRLAPEPDEEYRRILEVFHQNDIRYFFFIGGNDSMDTVQKLSAWFQELGEDILAVGIPKTIDNDVAGTDHTPGFGSAARYIAISTEEMILDSIIYDIPTVTLIEVMGRNAGWLTAAAALARDSGFGGPHMICMPEVPFDEEKFLARARELNRQKRHLIIAVSEGIHYADGRYVAAGEKLDVFGHQQLAGAANRLGDLLRRELHCKVRAIEPNILQRAAGHLQSETDIRESVEVGAAAVLLALAGKTGVMASLIRHSDDPYRISCGCVDIREAANLEKTVPLEWIDAENFDLREPLLAYLRPLIRNESDPAPGEPRYFRLPKKAGNRR